MFGLLISGQAAQTVKKKRKSDTITRSSRLSCLARRCVAANLLLPSSFWQWKRKHEPVFGLSSQESIAVMHKVGTPEDSLDAALPLTCYCSACIIARSNPNSS